jgi:hypothetical protein
VAHYEQLERGEAVPKKFHLTIVDEAARYRNAFKKDSDDDGPRPELLHYEILKILECPRIVYLSGTPILANPKVERDAFLTMMRASASNPLKGRVSVYDPRADPSFMKRFAQREDHDIQVPMLWSQTLLYFMFKKRPFRLKVDGLELVGDQETGNSFESQLTKISNNPFTTPKFTVDDPEASPKIMALVLQVERQLEGGRKQLVYSARKREGVEQIRYILVARELGVQWQGVRDTKQKTSPLSKAVANAARKLLREKYLILSGDMSAEERGKTIAEYNRRTGAHRNGRVLVITKAAGFGVDLNETHDVHLFEANPVRAEEEQVIGRALRLYAHKKGRRSTVHVWRYIATFPDLQDKPDENWVDVVDWLRFPKQVAPDHSPRFLEKVRIALFRQFVEVAGGDGTCPNASGVLTRCSIDQKHARDAAARDVRVREAVEELMQLDPDLGRRNRESSWEERARQVMLAHREARRCVRDGETEDIEMGRGWKSASNNPKATSFMQAEWWPRYDFEQFPGQYDLAWKNVTARMPQLPPPASAEADRIRHAVVEELSRLQTSNDRDILNSCAFVRQVTGACKPTQLLAFKHALSDRGIIRLEDSAWHWTDTKNTFKTVPLPGQRGHAELMRAFEERKALLPPPRRAKGSARGKA